MKEVILNRAKELESYIIEKRREFHKHPELKFEENRTSSIVKEELEKLGYKITETAKTGIIGEIGSENSGKTVALRADMDALPLQEENEVPYRSKIDGKMHACGHDAHTAMLLGAAKILAEIKDELEGNVKLVFQPAEEGDSGAKMIVEEDVLGTVDSIFGLHVNSEIPSGIISTKKGPIMASSDGFKIIIKGNGGHSAHPHHTDNTNIAALEVISGLNKIVSNNIDPTKDAVLTVPKFKGSDKGNVIPDKVEIVGSFRTFDEDVRDTILKRIKDISEYYSKAWNCEAEFIILGVSYPPTVNTQKETDFAIKTAKELGRFENAEKKLSSEDFSFYLKKFPGAFIYLGIADEEKGTDVSHHHPKFDVDEDVLYLGTALYSLLAYRYLDL